jgi:hypothetical protein
MVLVRAEQNFMESFVQLVLFSAVFAGFSAELSKELRNLLLSS